MITVTPKAAAHIKEMLQERKLSSDNHGLRLAVEGGGCSGMQYAMSFDGRKADDQIFSQDDAHVYVEPACLVFIDGSVIDYVDGLSGTGFRINNPKAKQTCGCGTSFEA